MSTRNSGGNEVGKQYRQPGPRFRPGGLPSLAVALLLPLLIFLGFWQLSRAEEKRQILVAESQRRAAPPVPVLQLLAEPEPAFMRVRLRGRFDPAHSLLLDNRVHQGRVGVEVLQPFMDRPSGRWLWVNRGWLPWPDRRMPPQFDTPAGDLELITWAYVPPGRSLLSTGNATGWPRLINRLEPLKIWQELRRPGVLLELRLESGPGLLTPNWPSVSMGPQKHQGYAVQWFGLAAALLALFVHLGIHRAREARHASIGAP